MAYSAPSMKVKQNIEPSLQASIRPQSACVIGPWYALHRFNTAGEEALMGIYDELVPTTDHSWPDHVAGGIVDLTTSKIQLKDTRLQYYAGTANGNLTADNNNRVLADFILKTSAAGNRDSALGTRDVQIGDLIRLEWAGPESFESVVTGLIPDVVAGTTAPTNVRAVGQGDTSVSSTELTPAPTAYTVVYNPSAYAGLEDGYPQDTYTIIVEQVGTGTASGGTLDGTRLRILSASEATVTVELGTISAPWGGFVYDIDLGTRGATFTVVTSGVGSVAVSDTWTVNVSMAYTEVDVGAPAEFDTNGPYTGEKNTQYILTVTSGGVIDTDTVVFGVTTNNGADTSGSISVAAAGVVAIGTKGMTATFITTTEWLTGDQVVFDVLAPSDGPYHTMLLQDNIPVTAVTNLDVKLSIRTTEELLSPFVTMTASTITVIANATVTSSLLGTPASYSVFGGSLYADYRELRTANTNVIGSVEDIDDVLSTLGPATQENPLSLGAYMAQQASVSEIVYYVAVASDDLAGYTAAAEALTVTRNTYGLAPLTDDEASKDVIVAHVNSSSGDDDNQWRLVFLSNDEPQIQLVLDEKSDTSELQVTVSEYSAGEYRLVTCVGALFQTSSVSPGDVLRINYSTTLGVTTWDEYVVDLILDEENLTILGGPVAPITTAIKAEIWRNLSADEYATLLAAYPGKYNNRRVMSVYVDGAEEADGTSLPTYYVAAAVAGQRSSLVPHAGQSGMSLPGVYIEQIVAFSDPQLNTIASGGNWIVWKDVVEGTIFTRHQVSSIVDFDDLVQREITFTTNLDDISHGLYDQQSPLVGRGNVSPDMLDLIRQLTRTYLNSVQGRNYSTELGPQILDYTINQLAQHAVHKDAVESDIDLELPAPMNHLTHNLNMTAGTAV